MKRIFEKLARVHQPNADRDVAIALAIIGVGLGLLRAAADAWMDERRMVDQHHDALANLVDELWEAHCQAHPEARDEPADVDDVPERDAEVINDGG